MAAMSINYAYAFTPPHKVIKSDTTYLRNPKSKTALKSSYLKNGLHLAMPPLKPAATSSLKVSVSHADEKILNNVQVFPNPVTDQINLKFSVSRNAIVSVKIMDLLGNEVISIFSQRVDMGEKNFSYSLSNKLSSGFYFVRIVAGTESVIRRISVL